MTFSPGSNTANYNNGAQWNGLIGNVTSVGTNGGPSAYGTLDQSGNVWEWNENTDDANKRINGGAWNSTLASNISASGTASTLPTTKSHNVGIRLAIVNSSGTSTADEYVPVIPYANIPDAGQGGVAYTYDIQTTPVTNGQYVVFLNAVASSGASYQYALYDANMDTNTIGGISRSGAIGSYVYTTKTNMANKPVVFADWFCAARLSN